MTRGTLTFDLLREVNVSRRERWGDHSAWNLADWANAAAGEMGECCNAVKKMRSVECDFANKADDPDRLLDTREKAEAAIADEIADTVIYLDLLAASLNIDLGQAIAGKFNRTSVKYDFPERLPSGKKRP